MIKYTLITLSLVLLVNCSDSFLEDKPDSALDATEFIQSPEDARMLINSAYDAMSFGSVLGGQFALISELMADGVNGDLLTNGDWSAHYTRTTDIFLGTTRTMMHDGSKVVNRANAVIEYLDLATGLPDSERDILTGEAYFLRGVLFFELVRFFAQPYGFTPDNSHSGIALRTTFTNEPINRSTVAEVYTQIISDLTEAARLLPESNEPYAGKWAAKGYLAKVYFQMNDFQSAWNEANEVIQNGGYVLDVDFKWRFDGSGNSGEIIFGLVSGDFDNDNANSGYRDYFRLDASTNTVAVYPSEDIFDATLSVSGDMRSVDWFVADEILRCIKFGVDSAYTNPVLHLTELVLIRAEAGAELGTDLTIAIEDVNAIRTRAGVANLSPSAPANQVISTCRRERHIEMYFENNRLHDLKRQAVHDNPSLKIRGAEWDCPGMVCQFPDNELKGNPDMQANEQGGCN